MSPVHTRDRRAAPEHAFLRQRLAMVDRWLSSPDHHLRTANTSDIRSPTEPESRSVLAYRREARLLRKLLAKTREGQALTTLKAWRRHLGGFLLQHRKRYAAAQDACDAWWQLPWDERVAAPRPSNLPAARYIDYDGAPWIIDDRFLAVLDDLITRLQKWLGEAEPTMQCWTNQRMVCLSNTPGGS